MKNINRAALLSVTALAALCSLSGCGRGDRGPEPYRWEHGDRIDREGHREVRWCDSHHEDEHCR